MRHQNNKNETMPQISTFSQKLLKARMDAAHECEEELQQIEARLLEIDSMSPEWDELLKKTNLLQVKIDQLNQHYGDENNFKEFMKKQGLIYQRDKEIKLKTKTKTNEKAKTKQRP